MRQGMHYALLLSGLLAMLFSTVSPAISAVTDANAIEKMNKLPVPADAATTARGADTAATGAGTAATGTGTAATGTGTAAAGTGTAAAGAGTAATAAGTTETGAAATETSAAATETGAAAVQPEAATEDNAKLWNLKDVDIRAFIHTVAEDTNKNFVIDPRVVGKVTFISAKPLNNDELYEAFLSVLQVNGFVALPDGAVIKIVPDYVAKGMSSPIYNTEMHKVSDEMAVSVAPLRYVPASELAAALNQFLTPSGHIAAYTPSNDLIVADRAGNIEHLMQLVRRIDQQRSTRIEVIHLRNAQAKVLVDTLKAMLGQKTTGAAGAANVAEPTLASDERTNSVLISGGSQEQRMQLRRVIVMLDKKNSVPIASTEVIYLKHLHAKAAATIVNGIIQNYLGKAKGEAAAPGQATSTSTSAEESSSSQNQAAASLFSTTIGGGMSGTGSTSGQSGGGTSTMFSSQGGFYTSNTQSNDISSIVGKTPQSGSVSPYVQWEESTNSLIVTAPRELMLKIKRVIAKLDIRRPQVLIEAVIAEVSETLQRELGIQWNTSGTVSFQTLFLPTLPLSIIGTNGKLATVSGGNDTVGQGLSLTANGNSQIRLLITALETDSDTNVLATPNLVTLDNEPAQIKIGSKVPFATAQIQNNPTGGNPFNFFDREDVGLVLTIDPQITPNGAIKLLIQQELSAIIPGTASSAGGNPTTSERFIRTTVMADNGKILVLGGLLQNQWAETTNQVPWISKIPGIGALFRDRSKSSTKTNLMIFLRPTIIYDVADEDRVTGGKYEYLRQLQLQVANGNPFRHNYLPPTVPVENDQVYLPGPFPALSRNGNGNGNGNNNNRAGEG